MKQGILDESGAVRCPKCGSTSFRIKRSFKAKASIGVAGAASFGVLGGVGALAAPKRIKCLACGELFKARAAPVASAPRPHQHELSERKPGSSSGRFTMPTLPTPMEGEPRGALVLLQPGIKRTVVNVLREIRPDLDGERVDHLIRNTRWAPQAVLVDRPMSEIKAVSRSMKAAGVPCKAIQGHDGTFWPPPAVGGSSETATLLLHRTTLVSGRAVDALVAIRPDLDADQVKALAKDGERKARKPLLVDRPLLDVEIAARILKRNGLRVDIVSGSPEAATASDHDPSRPTLGE